VYFDARDSSSRGGTLGCAGRLESEECVVRLVTFDNGQQARLGVLNGTRIIDLNLSDSRLPSDMLGFISEGAAAGTLARGVLERAQRGDLPDQAWHAGKDVRLLAPIPNPSKVVAVGLNYWDHCRETHTEPPESPVLFAKFPTSVVGPEDVISWDPAVTQQVDYEAELAIVMGTRAFRVNAGQARDAVFGYTCSNDVTARDLQRRDGQWVRGKSLDTFCPLGPSIVTTDEVADPQNLRIVSRLDGETMQDSNTREMIFDVPTLVEFITRAITLLPGDVILTGTPHGVGMARTPPVFLADGDVVEVEVEGIGTLRNTCRVARNR
jgi:2-keto-4-pentenoate hydratase/2-oxohepta-3-ene-1,7-dioic acid hydratase in catechol pathway